ncbi:hypothetical protein O181_093353 [Austropuccinia psidii MF-1]|uniref:DUF4939 domain-containing protein n=1 Tax=Austropuccinia psidii MF-1 TaxID=1389203 RepID=A0A9Q3P988_9BASI|nr:hypothetical protein [Austropuccinia psidii MF-1]
MPIQHSPLQRLTRSQARAQAVLTPTPRAPLNGTPAVSQLRAHLDRGSNVEGEEPSIEEGRWPRRSRSFSGVVGSFTGHASTTFKGPGEDGEFEPASEGTGGPTSAQSNQSEPSLLAIMQQMTQIMANLQAASSSEASRPPAFKTPSMKAPEFFDGTQPFKVRSFIQSCQLIFHNDPANFSQDRKKVLYSTSFLIGRAAKWIEPYLSNHTNQDPNYLLNSWKLFESQLFTLFGDPNEVRKSEAELDSLRMKEGRDFHPGLWINWPPILQDLLDITLELDTRYHERQNEKSNHQEKNPEASNSNSSHPQKSSSSSQKNKKNFQKRDMPHSSLLNKDFKLMNYEKERTIKEGLCIYCGGNHSLESSFKRPQNMLTQPSGNFSSQGKA